MSRSQEILGETLIHDAKMVVNRHRKNKTQLTESEEAGIRRRAAKYGVLDEVEAILA